MKKIVLYFFLAGFVAANAFGGADVVISRAIPGKAPAPENANTENDNENSINRATRRAAVNTTKGEVSDNKTTVSRSTRTTTKTIDVVPRNSQKNEKNVVSRNIQRTNNRPTVEDGANTVGRNVRTESASMNNSAAVRRAGITLRSTTAEVGGRAKIAGTDMQTGSNVDEQVRGVHGRVSILSGAKKQQTPTAESIANAKEILERTADLNSTCQQQYNECMDQFCAVVDANQKRCSCSANLARYAKAQKAVEDANAELNDVAQRIRYVGLSADEIHAILSATEAELEMAKTKDNTKNRSMLDDIADMIKDPTSSTTYTSTSSGAMILDMDFDFSSDDASDLFGLDLFNQSSDISSKRGKDLYKEATKRCKNVLNQCKDAGGTESQITGNYDLAIDKDCIAYEQGLEKLNQQLVSNVRSANLMLQKARLAVLENKNEYDVKECVGALEACMLDDMVCGDDYLKCLDPTKRYIDENGEVVLGKNLGNITAFMENYNNANITKDFIKASSKDVSCSNGDGGCIVNYLMSKIGTGQTIRDGGLCRAVLDKCQQFTYSGNTVRTAKYEPYNEVVINYIQRAMVNIKAAQARIISDYASKCMADISTCYNQQINQINTLSTTANVNNIYNIMTGTCYNVALTCGYAVFQYDADVGALIDTCENCKSYYTSKCQSGNIPQGFGNCTEYATATCSMACSGGNVDSNQKLVLIREISDLFYQSLLCPNNSTFDSLNTHIIDANRTKEGYANTRCKCDAGYTVWGGACVATCDSSEYRNTLGICSSCGEGLSPSGGSSNIENNTCLESSGGGSIGGGSLDGGLDSGTGGGGNGIGSASDDSSRV